MTPAQDEQVEQLFHEALTRPESARAAFLAEACADDEVRQAVERLLSGHQYAGDFLEAPVWEVAAEVLAAESVGAMNGLRLNHYQILSLLGKGGMGEVYLAEDTRLNRKVALKFLPADYVQDTERVRRFEREAKAASALNHPNILTIYEFGVAAIADGELHFIATEFIEGNTLRSRLSQETLSVSAVFDIALQIASAVSAAHRAKIIHRDLKPENFMLRPDGLVKVLDFGLAKLAGLRIEVAESLTQPEPEQVNLQLTAAGSIMGTAGYMSPEQARGEEVDARTDVFSFGVVMYEMLSRRQPFAGSSLSEIIREILHVEPPSLARLVPAVPRELERIVNRALCKDTAGRYADMSEVLADLKVLKQRLDDRAGLRKRQRLGLAFMLVLLALAAGAFYLARSARNADDRTGAIALNSIAVLPFANSNRDPNVEYLADGISESLINSLSQLPRVKVIARGSSFRYKGKDANLREVARALGVATLLTGSLRQSGDRLFINVELTNARDLTRIWGAQFDRPVSALQQMQTEIVGEVAVKLHLSLTEGSQQQLAKNGAVNSQAYELVLKGRFFRGNGTTERRKKAMECFQQAIAIEPNYALAWAELGNLYSSLMNVGEMAAPEAMAKARAAAERALAIDGNLLEAHYTLANCKMDQWDWAGAADSFRRIIGMNPNSARTLSGYSFLLAYTGQFEPAIVAARRACELDPISLGLNARLGQILYLARRYDESLEVLHK
ncbi:MAG: protein kinase, partial [Acidobacteria bacterium]|nr:protein kinase [Acidobacteriota bacterium]